MKNNRLIKSLLLSALFAGNVAYADCKRDATGNYDVICTSEETTAKVGIRFPSDKAKDPIQGEMEYITSKGIVRVSEPPYADKAVPVEDGVLFASLDINNAKVTYWNAQTGEKTVCNPPENKAKAVRFSDVRKGAVQILYGKNFVQVRKKDETSITYFAECRDSGSMLVFSALSGADRAILDKYGRDLTLPQEATKLPEIMERDDVVNEIISSLKTDNTRSTLLWGKAGTGKTAIAYRLAQRIYRKQDIPQWLEEFAVYEIQVGKFASKYAGGAESALNEVIAAAAGKKVVLLMDEVHQLLDMGKGGGDSSDLTELLKTDLANGRLAIIGTLTDQDGEYQRFVQKKAIMRRFNAIKVNQPSEKVLMLIYQALAKKMEQKYGVVFDDNAIKAMISLTEKYVTDEAHPGLGKKIMLKTAASLDSEREDPSDRTPIEVSKQQIRHQIGLAKNITSLLTGDGRSFREKVRDFPEEVRNKYVGHQNAINAIYETLMVTATGNRPKDRPAGIYLFLGPSGVGKTYLAKLMSSMFFGKDKYKEFAMNQYKQEHSIHSFLGAPPSYVGYRAGGGELTKWIQSNPESVINFDEVEKAHTNVHEILLRLLESGEIMDNSGIESKFTNGHIVMTSNFGMDLINAYDKQVMGIDDPDATEGTLAGNTYTGMIPQTPDGLRNRLIELMIERKAFGSYTEAFIGRIDNIVVFHHFTPKEQSIVAKFEVKKALESINSEYRNKVHVDPKMWEYLLSKGFSFHTGARKARALTQTFIVKPIARAMIEIDEEAEIEKIEVKLQGLSRGVPRGVAVVTTK